jgi:hypothetical protein
VLVVESQSVLSGLPCSVCHLPVRPGERVLLTYRDGRPHVMHRGLCQVSVPPPVQAPYAANADGWGS